MPRVRLRRLRHRTRLCRPRPTSTWLSWIGEERLAIGNLPTAATMPLLAEQGVTHVVNCRAVLQTRICQELAAERAAFGSSRVFHAPMWDFGQPQPPRRWSAAAQQAARVLNDDPHARVLVHCQQGRRRSVLVAYAILRLRGHPAQEAAGLITRHRHEARLVASYRASVERWLATDVIPARP